MEKVDGKKIAWEILGRLQKKPVPKKFLAALLVGNDAASKSFLAQKQKVAKELGIDFRLIKLPEETTDDALRRKLLDLAEQNECGGIVLQLPLPGHLDAQAALNTIPPEKDVDVLGARAQELFRAGKSQVLPPSVEVVYEILHSSFPILHSLTVAVVGRGKLVGAPVAEWLKGKAKEVIVLDKGDDFSRLKNADVVISGAGVPGLINPEMLKENALVIDFGVGKTPEGSLVGDFDPEFKIQNAKFKILYTPTPGGTGPILVAKLFENFYTLNK